MPGSRNIKRWQDIEEFLEAGIDVLSTVNVQHLESLNDVVQRITGVQQQETVPDEVVRKAEQIEIVDITPEALRRRLGDRDSGIGLGLSVAKGFTDAMGGAIRAEDTPGGGLTMVVPLPAATSS